MKATFFSMTLFVATLFSTHLALADVVCETANGFNILFVSSATDEFQYTEVYQIDAATGETMDAEVSLDYVNDYTSPLSVEVSPEAVDAFEASFYLDSQLSQIKNGINNEKTLVVGHHSPVQVSCRRVVQSGINIVK